MKYKCDCRKQYGNRGCKRTVTLSPGQIIFDDPVLDTQVKIVRKEDINLGVDGTPAMVGGFSFTCTEAAAAAILSHNLPGRFL